MLKEFFSYKNDKFHFGLGHHDLAGFTQHYEGPIYFYDLDFITHRADLMRRAFPNAKIYYAMKANANREVLKTLHRAGLGADIVSGGELSRALQVGFHGAEIIYSGVGKTVKEIDLALRADIYQLNVESIPELKRIADRAKALGKVASVSFRLNPNVDIKTHPYIATGLHENKFGMEFSALPELENILKANEKHLQLVGLSLHLGSQMLDFDGLRAAMVLLVRVFTDLQKRFPTCRRFDAGGGLGILYQEQNLEKEMHYLEQYAEVIHQELQGVDCQLQLEPGRWLVGHAGVLLTQIQYIKETPYRNFAIVDAGMVHLIRPALYEAHHEILPLQKKAGASQCFDIVGPICESADFFAKERFLSPIQQNDFLVILDCGAYGYVMASDYNLQTEAKEVTLTTSKSAR